VKQSAAAIDWEAMWAPYDEETYATVLETISADDVVLDIGAGDLCLTRRIAERARSVVALERNPNVAARISDDLPDNCEFVLADARTALFPEGTTTAVLLMRHCAHFALYVAKLQAIGCRRLITNARWGFGPEVIDLIKERQAFASVPVGWYACLCGSTGFVAGPVESLEDDVIEVVWEVSDCPACTTGEGRRPFTMAQLEQPGPSLMSSSQGESWLEL